LICWHFYWFLFCKPYFLYHTRHHFLTIDNVYTLSHDRFFQNVILFFMPIPYCLHWKSNAILHHKVNCQCFIFFLTIRMNEYGLDFLYGDLKLRSRHFGKMLMYYHVYPTFSKKNSQILINEDRSTCLPIVGEISVNDFPTVCHLFYYYLISWLTLNSVNWNSLGLLINCYDYVNNNQDYIFFNFHCLKLQHMSKISIITLTPKQSF
jgi:hypothetical protein